MEEMLQSYFLKHTQISLLLFLTLFYLKPRMRSNQIRYNHGQWERQRPLDSDFLFSLSLLLKLCNHHDQHICT